MEVQVQYKLGRLVMQAISRFRLSVAVHLLVPLLVA
jgi:hypothetical protein